MAVIARWIYSLAAVQPKELPVEVGQTPAVPRVDGSAEQDGMADGCLDPGR
ncbi:MAG: hypothetical protein ABI083_19465 [Lapillicoccus sp.]